MRNSVPQTSLFTMLSYFIFTVFKRATVFATLYLLGECLGLQKHKMYTYNTLRVFLLLESWLSCQITKLLGDCGSYKNKIIIIITTHQTDCMQSQLANSE